MLIAKTHFGKSLIWQAVSLLVKESIAIVVLRFNQTGVEQAECISNLGGKPCILNADTMTDKLLEEVKACKYTHVLLSPALELHDKFRLMAIQPKFQERLSLVAVDDAHLVARWGRNFREGPGQLVQLRILTGHDVPWLACSATLDQATLEKVRGRCAFSPEVKVHRTSINRPELALREVRSAGETAHLNIPKTVVFFDTASEAYSALWKCRKWLELSDKHRYTPEQTKSFLRVFDQNTAPYDKELIIADFRRLALDSSVRVLFATEALEWVDLPDIRRVVQYGFPKACLPAVPWRRGGRASRDGKDGEFIFLVDEWAFGSRDEAAVQMYARLSEAKRLKHNTFAEFVAKEREPKEDSDDEDPEPKQRAIESFNQERLERLPKFWYDLVNAGVCIREQFLDYFGEPKDDDSPTRKERCCSNCNPDLILKDLDLYHIQKESGPPYNEKRKLIAEDLEEWAWSKCRETWKPNGPIPHACRFLTRD
ncbi:hypothetical protein N7535_006500 [Penicillium sp. DV-2018c]|nr:hypothetical protein N7535_006500 [Penicillium sp. DV-2018c]